MTDADRTSNQIISPAALRLAHRNTGNVALKLAAEEIERLQVLMQPVETSDRIEAPHSGFCAVARGGRCDCGTDALNGKSSSSPFEPIIQCDTTTARVQKLLEMDAVPSYVVRTLLHERDSWRENYWMRMEEIGKQSSPEEPDDAQLREARDIVRTLLAGKRVNVDRMEALLGPVDSLEESIPHKYATHGLCHICGGQPGDPIHAEKASGEGGLRDELGNAAAIRGGTSGADDS